MSMSSSSALRSFSGSTQSHFGGCHFTVERATRSRANRVGPRPETDPASAAVSTQRAQTGRHIWKTRHWCWN